MDSGPDAPASAVPGLDRLPAGPALFAGRRAELAALRAAATRRVSGRCPVLVLAGRPGSGRTALAARFAHQLVEVLTGARPSGQLMRHTSLDGYGQLASLVRAGALRRGGPADRPRLGPVHDRSPSPDAVEACVRVDLGRRHHMVAFRLEQRGPAGQWQCTAVEAR